MNFNEISSWKNKFRNNHYLNTMITFERRKLKQDLQKLCKGSIAVSFILIRKKIILEALPANYILNVEKKRRNFAKKYQINIVTTELTMKNRNKNDFELQNDVKVTYFFRS